MSGLVRGANLSGWSLEQRERDALVSRLSDTLLAASFHWGKDVGDCSQRARGVEARAYATAQVASTTTSGARPAVEGLRLYSREAAKLVQALLLAAGEAGAPKAAPNAAAATVRRTSPIRPP